jgi:hypothetical protein
MYTAHVPPAVLFRQPGKWYTARHGLSGVTSQTNRRGSIMTTIKAEGNVAKMADGKYPWDLTRVPHYETAPNRRDVVEV